MSDLRGVPDALPGGGHDAGADVGLLCPVAVRCLAMLDPTVAARAISALPQWRQVATGPHFDAECAHAPLAPLWEPIATLRVGPFTTRRYVADIAFRNGASYSGMRFAGLGALPLTILSALPGRAMTDVVDHPLFAGQTLGAGSSPPTAPGMAVAATEQARLALAASHTGPPPSIPADAHLKLLVDQERTALEALLPAWLERRR